MKTPDEIKKGLECFVNGKFPGRDCGDCPYLERPSEREWQCPWEQIGSDALAYIQQLEAAQPKWISVKERLPEDGQIVFAYAAGCCDLLKWSAVEETWLSDIGWSKKGDVTHWMPLPSALEEDE